MSVACMWFCRIVNELDYVGNVTYGAIWRRGHLWRLPQSASSSRLILLLKHMASGQFQTHNTTPRVLKISR